MNVDINQLMNDLSNQNNHQQQQQLILDPNQQNQVQTIMLNGQPALFIPASAALNNQLLYQMLQMNNNNNNNQQQPQPQQQQQRQNTSLNNSNSNLDFSALLGGGNNLSLNNTETENQEPITANKVKNEPIEQEDNIPNQTQTSNVNSSSGNQFVNLTNLLNTENNQQQQQQKQQQNVQYIQLPNGQIAEIINNNSNNGNTISGASSQGIEFLNSNQLFTNPLIQQQQFAPQQQQIVYIQPDGTLAIQPQQQPQQIIFQNQVKLINENQPPIQVQIQPPSQAAVQNALISPTTSSNKGGGKTKLEKAKSSSVDFKMNKLCNMVGNNVAKKQGCFDFKMNKLCNMVAHEDNLKMQQQQQQQQQQLLLQQQIQFQQPIFIQSQPIVQQQQPQFQIIQTINGQQIPMQVQFIQQQQPAIQLAQPQQIITAVAANSAAPSVTIKKNDPFNSDGAKKSGFLSVSLIGSEGSDDHMDDDDDDNAENHNYATAPSSPLKATAYGSPAKKLKTLLPNLTSPKSYLVVGDEVNGEVRKKRIACDCPNCIA
jgi:hypothetical protein